ncbi:hypothetical protein Tco_0778689 [Tanacetum coccineum]
MTGRGIFKLFSDMNESAQVNYMDVEAFDLINQSRLTFQAQAQTERFDAIVNLRGGSWKPRVSDGLTQGPDIASAGRSITVISRSITGYGLMILGCARSLKANLQHMEALSTTKAGYLTFTEV